MSTRSDATMTISEIFVELQVPPQVIISICPNEWLLDELHVDISTALEFKIAHSGLSDGVVVVPKSAPRFELPKIAPGALRSKPPAGVAAPCTVPAGTWLRTWNFLNSVK